MEKLVRNNILAVTPYVSGKPIEETRRELGLREVVKLASNENALGPSPKAVEAIKKALPGLNRYPDSQGFYLKKKLAKALRLGADNFVLGNGSDELIDIVIRTFVEDDENVVTADLTFLEYEIVSSVNARKVVRVPLRYFKYDLEALRKKIDRKTKIVFIANPNNPTGTYVTRCELEEFLAGLPANVIVVLDEAYDSFIDTDDFPFGINYIKKANVLVFKTFSKAYGLAGIRLGYAVGRPELISFMERVRQPFNVNSLAQAAACAALDDRKFLEKTRAEVLRGKEYLYAALRGLGIACVQSAANFLLVDTGRDGVGVFRELLKFGVIVRDMKQYGLKNFVRVTIGTRKENEKFITALKKVLSRPA